MDSTAPTSAVRPRALVVRLGVLIAAIAIGLLLQGALSERLADIAGRADQDVVAARRELAHLMRVVFVPVLGLTTAIGAHILRTARRALDESRFPPSETRLWSGRGVVLTGAPARRMARFACGLGALLVLCSLAGGGLVWWITRVLLLCRASG